MSFILADEKSFYHKFERDLCGAKNEVIIESPFITVTKLRSLKPIFESLVGRGVKVFVITRHPEEHDALMAEQSEAGIRFFERIGVQVFMCRDHHRKIAMIDRRIIWKGSLKHFIASEYPGIYGTGRKQAESRVTLFIFEIRSNQ